MTAKVKIELMQGKLPVVVEILSPDGEGRVSYRQTLRAIGDVCEDYVYSTQTLRVREMSIEEAEKDVAFEQRIQP